MLKIKGYLNAKMRKNAIVITGVFAVVMLLGSSYAIWHLYRAWNYAWGYESMVEKTVCDMVKPEYLKRPCK